MKVNWDSPGMHLWMEEAAKEQQGLFDLLGSHEWRILDPSEYNNLKRKIGFALFGRPEEEPDEKLNDGTGYKKKQIKQIEKILDLIKNCIDKNGKNVWVNILFVSGKEGDDYLTFPVIRIPKQNAIHKPKNDIFIDSLGRVYKDWQDYLESNTLPECVICYPKNGMYSSVTGVIEVEFGTSPAGNTGRHLLQACDIGGTVAGIGAAGVGVAASCVPVAWPFVAGAVGVSVLTGGYAAGRSIQVLVDRSQHKQTLGLNSPEARNCWLGIAGSIVDIAAGGTVTYAARMVRTGSRMTLATQIAVKSVTIGACVVNALGVTSGLAGIIMKVANKEEITPLEVFQFTSAVLFLTNSVISVKQAQSMLKGIAERGTGKSLGSTEGSASQFSEYMKINILREGILPSFTGCSNIASFNFRGTFLVFCQWVSRKVIQMTASLKKGLIITVSYMAKVREILYSFWENWKEEITETVNKICEISGSKFRLKHGGSLSDHIKEAAGILIAERLKLEKWGITGKPSQQGKDISDNAVMGTASHNDNEPNNLVHEDRHTSVSHDDDDAETSVSSYDGDTQTSVSSCDDDTETSLSYEVEVIKIFKKFVVGEKFRNPADFSRYMKFVCDFVTSQLKEEKSKFEKVWKIIQELNPNVSMEDFKKRYGISGNENNHFLQEVLKKFRSKEQDVFTLLKLAYHHENADKSSKEQCGRSSIVMDGVTFHPFYNQLGHARNGMLSKEQYCDMTAELAGQHLFTDDIHMSARGDTAIMQVNGGADVVLVQSLLEDGKVSGVALLLHSP